MTNQELAQKIIALCMALRRRRHKEEVRSNPLRYIRKRQAEVAAKKKTIII